MPTDKRLTKTARKAVIVEPDKDQLDSTISLAIALINRKLSIMASLEASEVDSGEVYKLSNSLAGLTRARSEHRKLDTITKEAFVQAGSEFKERLKTELQKHPKLCEQLINIADTVQDRMQ